MIVYDVIFHFWKCSDILHLRPLISERNKMFIVKKMTPYLKRSERFRWENWNILLMYLNDIHSALIILPVLRLRHQGAHGVRSSRWKAWRRFCRKYIYYNNLLHVKMYQIWKIPEVNFVTMKMAYVKLEMYFFCFYKKYKNIITVKKFMTCRIFRCFFISKFRQLKLEPLFIYILEIQSDFYAICSLHSTKHLVHFKSHARKAAVL